MKRTRTGATGRKSTGRASENNSAASRTRAAPILAVRDLRVRRGDTQILRGLDWAINRGEHWVILGANGCGKTSLLAALTGYLSPTAGEIHVLGSTYGRTDWRELRKHVGFVSNALTRGIEPDEPALHVVASGPDAMLNLWHPPRGSLRTRSLALLRAWGAGGLADRPWGVMSQGERQRALIARALLGRPPLLLLDEPAVGLDPVAREHLLALIQRETQRPRGPSLALITHHVEEITPGFTHVLMLRRGQVVASGRIHDVLTARHLSATFGTPVRLRRGRDGRWSLTVKT